jgi:transposase
MAQKPIVMEQLKQILQLHLQSVPIREIVRRTGVSRNSVKKYLKQHFSSEGMFSSAAADENIPSAPCCPYPKEEAMLQQLQRQEQLQAYFTSQLTELNRTGVTRQLLWQEYLQQYPEGYGYSQFCHYLSLRLKQKDVAMHLSYKPADMIMIDFAGKKLSYVDADTAEVFDCEVFVSVLPYSGLIFCMAVASQKSADLITCINAMLRYYGGVTATILCDNLKTAVIRPCRYEPVFTELCYQLAEHYQTTFSATRPYSPTDKALVEGAVKIVYRHIYAPIRNDVFYSLAALNKAIASKLALLNDKPYKNTAFSRRYFFDEQERHLIQPLATAPFSIKKVVVLTVQRNYHIQLTESHRYYSVPYQYVGKKVKVLYTPEVVEIYYDNNRIALHVHRLHQQVYNTDPAHMPPHHRHMQEIKGWNKDDLLRQAGYVGKATAEAAALILQSNSYVEQNYKSCYGMLMLQKKYTSQRLEAACARALQGSRVTYTMIKNILTSGLDKQVTLFDNAASPIPAHDNIRGKDSYQ